MDTRWISEHFQWLFGAVCTVAGGVFGLARWLDSRRKKEDPQVKTGNSLDISGSQNNVAVIGTGAAVHGQVMVGSYNVQNVIIGQTEGSTRIPLRNRKPSSPTANEIRQGQESALDGIPMYLHEETLNRFWDSFVGVPFFWPIRIYGIDRFQRSSDGGIIVEARYGEESWGAVIEFDVRVDQYPIVKTLRSGHRGFIEGQVKRINAREITVNVSKLDVE